MPLYDYQCKSCKNRYESLAKTADDSDAATCPKCGKSGAERLVVKFRIGGQGDLRETTDFHGCHRPLDDGGADHHDHGHTHGPGCGHSSDSTGGD